MQRAFVIGALFSLLVPVAAFACETWEAGELTVQHAWSRATIGADRPAAFYVEIANRGQTDDSLIGIATPAAGMPMIHRSLVTDGVASMSHAPSLPIPAGETVRLAPAGYHGMLMDLAAPLIEGDRFPATLTFERAGEVTVEVEVVSLRGEGPTCED